MSVINYNVLCTKCKRRQWNIIIVTFIFHGTGNHMRAHTHTANPLQSYLD